MRGNAPCRTPGCKHLRSQRALICSVCWHRLPKRLRRALRVKHCVVSKRVASQNALEFLRLNPSPEAHVDAH